MTPRRAALLLAALFPTALSATDKPLTVPYEQFVLPNGLNVIVHSDHTTPVVSVNIRYDVGSARERPGRTGLAHLFEHILFEGSEHVPEGKFDEWLEAAGGTNNGATDSDHTFYWQDVPSNALELALFLESDRMGHLLAAMSPAKVDGQRDVVKNERRQSVENRPYGLAWETLDENLYPPGHPYHHPTIGSMEDLTAASYEDVVEFFRDYYGPGNATLSVAGDVEPAAARRLVEKWFGDVPPGRRPPPLAPPAARLETDKRLVLEDRVQLPRLYVCWLSPPRFAPGDAELDLAADLLAGGRSSRLYRRLVYELESAQEVVAFQRSRRFTSTFCILATARQGHGLAELEAEISTQIDQLADDGPTERELTGAIHRYETEFLGRLERVGGFDGKADLLNLYYLETANPDYFNEDLSRYRAVGPADLRAAVRAHLRPAARVVLSVVPEGRRGLAVPAGEEASIAADG